jgi:hypothetical protein
MCVWGRGGEGGEGVSLQPVLVQAIDDGDRDGIITDAHLHGRFGV